MTPYTTARLLEDRILFASPLELIQILFEEGQICVRNANAALASGNVKARGEEVSKCVEILNELTMSLSFDGGKEAANRRRLYASMQLELIDAHASSNADAFTHLQKAFQALLDNWNETIRILKFGVAPVREQQQVVEDDGSAYAPASSIAYGLAGAGANIRSGWTL